MFSCIFASEIVPISQLNVYFMNQRIFRVEVIIKREHVESNSLGFINQTLFNGYLSEEDYHLLIDKCESNWLILSELVCNVDLLTETDLFKKG